MRAPDGLRRFARGVRKTIRDQVSESREPPALTMWVSHGPSPRRNAAVPIGAAASPYDVKANVREGVTTAWAEYAAVGRALADVTPGSDAPALTTQFGLVVAADERWEAWLVDISAGSLGAWQGPFKGVPWAQETAELLMSALRSVQGALATCPGCNGEAKAIVCPVCGRGGVIA